jgi:simple sugar transport system ATP-binding protein
MLSKMNILKMENIHKWFGKVHALAGVDFSVDAGEVVGLIGENGAGKSTLIKIISGIYPPDEGKIYWKGKEVSIPSVEKARELGIETVHQDRAVIGTLSVAENIFLAREPKKAVGPLKIIDHNKMRKRAVELTKELGLKIDSPTKEARLCSGGERQGVAVARALQFEAELVILDEPDAGLATSGRLKIYNFIKKLSREERGCVYVTPDAYRAVPIADRFVVLANGKVMADIINKDLSANRLESLMRIR